MDHNQVMVKIVTTETLTNKCLRNLANNFKHIDLTKFEKLPANLKAILLRIVSKRGYIDDESIGIFVEQKTKVLELNECSNLTDIGVSKLSVCKYLRKIDLNSNYGPREKISSKSICELALSCKFLDTVLLRRCINVEDDAIISLASNCKLLTNLNLGNCPRITDKSLIAIGANCNNLQSINITATQVTDNGVFSLMSLNISKKIEEIHLAHCESITDESIEYILLQSKTIKYLMFHGCKNTTDASRLALEDYMANSTNQKVKHLTWSIY